MNLSARSIGILIAFLLLLIPVSVTSAAGLTGGQDPMIQATITTGNASRTVQPTPDAPTYLPSPVSSRHPGQNAGISPATITSQPGSAGTPLPAGVMISSLLLAVVLAGCSKKAS